MRKLLKILVTGLFLANASLVQAKVNIFACEPEWAALAKEIGGAKVKTFAATHAKQDPHHIRARPSLIAKARRADIIFCSGGGLEVGWLPILLQKAKKTTQPGRVGYLMAADYVNVLEKPIKVDRSMGDVHPEGNPHIHLNPNNILLIAGELTQRLEAIDESNVEFYRKQLADFTARWQQAMDKWQKDASNLRGKTAIVHHRAFSYLLDWLGIQAVASLEPKPGIPPTTTHLKNLLQQLQNQPANIIIRTAYEPDKASQWLSKKTNIPAIILPYTIGGDAKSNNLFELFERSIELMQNSNSDY